MDRAYIVRFMDVRKGKIFRVRVMNCDDGFTAHIRADRIARGVSALYYWVDTFPAGWVCNNS